MCKGNSLPSLHGAHTANGNDKTVWKECAEKLTIAVFAINYSIFQLFAAFKLITHSHEVFSLFPFQLQFFAFIIAGVFKVKTAIASAFAI